ncbi:Aminoglycoside phosphotransferase [Rhodospirillaceae bacterium LM-1]|nr:Aminoglycoside phosphotransferase [Rhodospirillaceae bacterium LM-1]
MSGESRRLDMEAFLERAGWASALRRPLPGDASFRRYIRLDRNGQAAMLMDAPPPKEDVRPFLLVARHLSGLGLSAPKILAEDREKGFLLLEDFGDATFTRLLAQGESETRLYDLAIDALIALHANPLAAQIEVPPYDDDRLMAEACLLVDWYMPEMLGRETPKEVVDAYRSIWLALFAQARRVPETLVLRDFHVDNLMELQGRSKAAGCGLLDFQDAVLGPVTYDLMSLIEDARRDLAPGLPERLKQRYLAAFPGLDRQAFAASMAILAAQRHCKVIGIFTRLYKRDGKPVYLGHIPRLWRLLNAALDHPALGDLKSWLDMHMPADRRGVPS